MNTTNIILAIFLTASIAQAQNSPLMNADSILASTATLPFSEVQHPSEFTAKSGKIAYDYDKEIVEDALPVKVQTQPNFVFFAYPSMFTDALYVTTDVIEPSEIQLVNEAGQIVFKQETEGMVENEKLTIPSVLPAGTYFLKIKDKEAASVKLIKRN